MRWGIKLTKDLTGCVFSELQYPLLNEEEDTKYLKFYPQIRSRLAHEDEYKDHFLWDRTWDRIY